MKVSFGLLPSGEEAKLYTISCGGITARITDYGASLVSLQVPDSKGVTADVVLGYDNVSGYVSGGAYFGATVGRNANRICDGRLPLAGESLCLPTNNNGNSLHSGPDGYSFRLWNVTEHLTDRLTLALEVADGDQGFPGNTKMQVTYLLESTSLKIRYDGICDRDTVFNFTNHSYFNLAGHEKTDLAMQQLLQIPGGVFCVADDRMIPTGELRQVDGTPMDFRTPKAVGRDIDADYAPLRLAGGYDHNFEVCGAPCAVLSDPHSGRTMEVYTDCPGIQLYSGNFVNENGKEGVFYPTRSGVALETQFYPDAVNHPEWKQPFTPANTPYHSETEYRFL